MVVRLDIYGSSLLFIHLGFRIELKLKLNGNFCEEALFGTVEASSTGILGSFVKFGGYGL